LFVKGTFSSSKSSYLFVLNLSEVEVFGAAAYFFFEIEGRTGGITV
jgi:hypothetical protein